MRTRWLRIGWAAWVALWAGAVVATSHLSPAVARAEEPAVDFVRDVQPIFREHCLSCHGPEKQKSGYRLDVKQMALDGGEFGEAAVVAGKPDESPLLRYVTGKDAIVMPPEGARLSEQQISTLRAWIEQGAKWPDEASAKVADHRQHWAFQPLAKAPPPSVAHEGFPLRNAVDAFVLEKLLANNLKPSPEADRRTLVRRLYLDVLGLPPSPEEIQAFVEDADPQAYEKLVDRLLASPHFGERAARYWLDAVRFAESHGFEMNQPRPNAWPYRDYVIRAFNEDKPYDRFVHEQLAGDALGADAATGFLVAGSWDQVKSPDPVLTANQRADELHDMVSTTASAFLGLTVGCARCHNHKFDPIPQTDYYALKACLSGVQHGERPMPGPEEPQRQERLAQLRSELATVDAALARLEPLDSGRRILLLDDASDAAEELVPSQPAANHAAGTDRGYANDPGDRHRLPNLGRAYKWWYDVKSTDLMAWSPRVAGRWRIWLSWGCGWHTHAKEVVYLLDLDGDPATRDDQTELVKVDQRMFADGSGEPFANKPLWSGLRYVGAHELTPTSRILLRSDDTGRPVTADLIVLEEAPAEASPAADANSTTESTQRTASGPTPRAEIATAIDPANQPLPQIRRAVTSGENIDRFAPTEARYVRFTIGGTNSAEPCIDELEIFAAGDDSNLALAANGAKASASSSLPGYDIHKLAHVNDGRYGNSRSWISNEPGRGWVQIELAEVRRVERVVWSRDRETPPKYFDRTATDYKIEVSLDGQTWQTVASSASRLPMNWLKSGPNSNPHFAHHLSDDDIEQFDALQARRKSLQAEIDSASRLPMVYAGRFTTPEPTKRFHRGDPTQPREDVPPGGLSQIGPPLAIPADASDQQRRLALAHAITDHYAPLAARVMVNRIFQQRFGRGIVDTPSDFGASGAKPTHPELLDWLAAELIQPSDANAAPWSLKHVHRLLLVSSTYRQSSRPREDGLQADAGATLLWRYPPRRLEAETLRDAILTVSGKLDRAQGGPGFDLFEPNTNYVKVYTPKQSFGPETFRRMIYQSKPRMQLDDTFGAFDCPDGGQIAPKRSASITPLQALNLLNSPFLVQQAEFFAARVRREAGEDLKAQTDRAFLLAFGRPPSDEQRTAATHLAEQHGLFVLCRALFNANEFVVLE